MKSTYQLAGVYWDRRPEARSWRTCGFDDTFQPVGSPCSLFDINGARRYVSLSDLWTVESDDRFRALIATLRGCARLAVLLDYTPGCAAGTHRTFYRRRLGQVVHALRQALPGTMVVCMRCDRERKGERP
ncbi:MAG: hypothetical protein UHD09_06270 [Bifidobacterium sp.]|nr:hypothetical protein [Bifidobacterium sp.]